MEDLGGGDAYEWVVASAAWAAEWASSLRSGIRALGFQLALESATRGHVFTLRCTPLHSAALSALAAPHIDASVLCTHRTAPHPHPEGGVPTT